MFSLDDYMVLMMTTSKVETTLEGFLVMTTPEVN